jgi:hypothetical protein
MLCLKEHVKCVCNTKWYDLIYVSDWVQYRCLHMILEICISSVPERNVVALNHETEVCMYMDLVSDSR